jgi:TrmH family RNA methyltransferase
LAEIELPPEPLVAVLEGVEKPGNLGAILRSADAAGVAAIVVADGRTDLFNPAAIRASLGTVFHVPICAASATETLDWLDRHGLDIFAAQPASGRLYTDIDLRKGVAVVFGTEATGLSPVWAEPACQGIRLPQRGIADSLNVAVAAAVVFYEALRQRGA